MYAYGSGGQDGRRTRRTKRGFDEVDRTGFADVVRCSEGGGRLNESVLKGLAHNQLEL